MTRFSIEIPEELISQLEFAGYSVQDVVVRAIERYVQADLPTITESRTWQLCGSLTVSDPAPEYIVGKDQQGKTVTNYAEKVDDVLY
jgi:hypothetical protein